VIDTRFVDWFRSQTLDNVHDLLSHKRRAYLHPYGFTVCRLDLEEHLPWQLRLHFWPAPIEVYELLSQAGTESQLVHAHGWDLMSKVLQGALEERTYSVTESITDPFSRYSVPSRVAQVSVLEGDPDRVSVMESRLRVRRPEDGTYEIVAGMYHSTLPASASVSLVATRQGVGQVSFVIDSNKDGFLSHPTPDILGPLSVPSFSSESKPWASFIFLLQGQKILLIETFERPGTWLLPGGLKGPSHSSPLMTLQRRVFDQINLTVRPPEIRWLTNFSSEDGGDVCVWMARHLETGELEASDSTVKQARWWRPDEVAGLPLDSPTKIAFGVFAGRAPS
jgi:ADP-ribose pyrophosphatase YjhB (NUDIX family)